MPRPSLPASYQASGAISDTASACATRRDSANRPLVEVDGAPEIEPEDGGANSEDDLVATVPPAWAPGAEGRDDAEFHKHP
jgi:hypothetical protein